MLKNYIWNGAQFQFEVGQQPDGAVEVEVKPQIKTKAVEPPNKEAHKPANKARKVGSK